MKKKTKKMSYYDEFCLILSKSGKFSISCKNAILFYHIFYEYGRMKYNISPNSHIPYNKKTG